LEDSDHTRRNVEFWDDGNEEISQPFPEAEERMRLQ
jgi:hypothetical protein